MAEIINEQEHSGTEETPSPSSATHFRKVSITAGGAALFLLLRMFAISNWDWHTTTEVLASVNFSNAIPIAFGTLFAAPKITAALVSVLLPVAAVDLAWPVRNSGRSVDQYMLVAALTVITFALVLSYQMWWILVIAAAIGGVFMAVRLARKRGTTHEAISWAMRKVGAVAMIAFLILAAVIRTPWTVREHIETTTETVEGYVLEVPSGYLTVLTSGDREVKILVSSEVESRTAITD